MRLRWLVGAVAIAAVLLAVIASSWAEIQRYRTLNPTQPVSLQDDGSAEIGGAVLRLMDVESQNIVGAEEGDWGAPDGWVVWQVTVAVEELPPAEDGGPDAAPEPGWFRLRVVATDGNVYTRPDSVPYIIGPESISYVMDVGTYGDVVLLPDGVEPVTVQVLPGESASPYWAFPVAG